ncbi:uncharacterized protein LOC143420524 isoform X2 [Maylandia zebra]
MAVNWCGDANRQCIAMRKPREKIKPIDEADVPMASSSLKDDEQCITMRQPRDKFKPKDEAYAPMASSSLKDDEQGTPIVLMLIRPWHRSPSKMMSRAH